MTAQKRLEGTEAGLDKELVELADEYVKVRDLRMDYLKQETDLSSRLTTMMRNKGFQVYRYEGKVIELETKETEKVHVRKEKEKNQPELGVPLDTAEQVKA